MNNPIYNLISALGTFVTSLVTGAIRFYKRYILFTLKNLSIYFINYNKKSFSSVKTFLVRAFILIASVISGVAVIINTRSTKVEATKVILNGDTVGYIKTEESAEKIEKSTLKKLNTKTDYEIEFKATKTEPYNILSDEALSGLLVQKIAPDYIKVCEVYIDDRLICAVEEQLTAHSVINELLEAEKKKNKKASVSFAETISPETISF